MRALLFLMALCCLNAFGAETNTFAKPHTWTLKSGVEFVGDVYDYKGTNQIIIRGAKDWKTIAFNIADLSTEDQLFASDSRKLLPLHRAGYSEVTAKVIQSFPERVENKPIYMIGFFYNVDSSNFSYMGRYAQEAKATRIAFTVTDKEGKMFFCCTGQKSVISDSVMDLKGGDRILMAGTARNFGSDYTWFDISSVTKLESITKKRSNPKAKPSPTKTNPTAKKK